MSKFLKRLWFTCSALIITTAIVFSLFRALTPWVKQYKAEVEQHLTTLIGAPVTIDTMKTGWYWFKPVIKLKDVTVWDHGKADLKLKRLFIGIDTLKSLWQWQIQPGIVYIDQIHLTLQKNGDTWEVKGLPHNPQATQDVESYKPLLAWILSQQKIIIHQLSCDVYLKGQKPFFFRDLNFTMTRTLAQYHLKGRVKLAQTVPTEFEWIAKISLNPNKPTAISGQAYVSAQHLQPVQWQELIPSPLQYRLVDGTGNVQVWTDWSEGKLKNLQSNLALDHLAWINTEKSVKQTIQTIPVIKANIAWKTLKTGWKFSADHLDLNLNNKDWPENALLLSYKEENQTYFAYARHILIDSLSSLGIDWPVAAQKILSATPHGQLEDTRMQVKDKTIDYVLTHFSNLGWKSNKEMPGVENISGTLRWQPNEGRLEIDGEPTTLFLNQRKPITFSALNAAFDWKILANGLRVSMGRFVLTHPSFLLSAEGVADEVTSNTMGPLRLNANFSGTEVQQWLQYLPAKYLKPGLDDWLKKGIKVIKKADGELTINGDMKYFPFETQPGDFVIKSYINGAELTMSPGWPLVKELEGYLDFNKRNLEARVTHANLSGVPVTEGNLQVHDIGLDKERLLVHAKTESSGPSALAYIAASPLQEKLAAMHQLHMQGPLALDLKMDIPLSNEVEPVLFLGDLSIQNNTLRIPKLGQRIQFNDLNGNIKFDQDGVLNGELNGMFFKNPIQFTLKPVRQPLPATEVNITSKLSAETLASEIQPSLSTIIHGVIPWKAVLTLPNDASLSSHLVFQSDLVGLGIDLPTPLGKSTNKKAPLAVDIELNTKNASEVLFNYNDELRGKVVLREMKKGGYNVKQGEIRLGDVGKEEHPADKRGLQIYGKLSSFNLQTWQMIKEKLARQSTGNSDWQKIINGVDLKFDEVKILNEVHKNLSVNIVKADAGAWAIGLEGNKLKANLYYQPLTNTLTGIFNHLILNEISSGKKMSEEINPMDIPNLEIKIESLILDSMQLGELILKTKSLPDQWQVNDLKLSSPYYQLLAKGKWQKNEKVNHTELEADLIIKSFSRMLDSLGIAPMVEATKGTIDFQGGWDGPFYDFSLNKVQGKMAIQFKSGRITNLSSDTQGKLGFAKLLSILSLQTIPRRLQLDFSDLSQSGYSFDRFNGSFDINKGIMTTKDSDMDGPVAYTSIAGDIDLVKQLFDLNLGVYPHIIASLPVVATIAGGPIAGIATWAASKIIDEGMQRISGYTYKVSGPWSQPVVQQVKIFKGKH